MRAWLPPFNRPSQPTFDEARCVSSRGNRNFPLSIFTFEFPSKTVLLALQEKETLHRKRGDMKILTTAKTVRLAGCLLMSSAMFTGGTALASCPDEAADYTPVPSQTAYAAGSHIRIPVVTDHDEPLSWRLLSGGTEVASGITEPFGLSEAAGVETHTLDVGRIGEAGEYTLSLCDGQTMIDVSVETRAFDALSDDALNYFYLNRAGVEITMPRAGDSRFTRSAGHPEEIVTCFSGEDRFGRDWPGCSASYDVTGGWYDAGDYGKYSVPAGHTIWLLLNAYERMIVLDERSEASLEPEKAETLLEEARWGLDWLMSMQVPEGTTLSVQAHGVPASRDDVLPITEIDASGHVFAKVHERQWLPLPILPEDADETRYVYPPTTSSTLNLAGASAMAARIWAERDPDYAAKTLAAAKRAFAAAIEHPDLLATNAFDGGGGYGDQNLIDEFLWAATELYVTTGEDTYLRTVRALQEKRGDAAPSDLGWASYDLQPDLSLVLNQPEDSPLYRSASSRIIAAADAYLADAEADGFFVPYPAQNYTWGSNGAVASRGVVLMEAYRLSGNDDYKRSAHDVVNYLLGQNPMETSFVAGYGESAMRHAHHRFWAEGADDDFPPAAPGALSGGPNINSPADPVAKKLVKEGCAPQTCWVDDVDSYAMNEVAIYWNAALYSLVSGLDTLAVTE